MIPAGERLGAGVGVKAPLELWGSTAPGGGACRAPPGRGSYGPVCTKTSMTRFVSASTRFFASDVNATTVPFAPTAGA